MTDEHKPETTTDEHEPETTTRRPMSRAQRQILIVGIVALMLPMVFIVIILAINFGGVR